MASCSVRGLPGRLPALTGQLARRPVAATCSRLLIPSAVPSQQRRAKNTERLIRSAIDDMVKEGDQTKGPAAQNVDMELHMPGTFVALPLSTAFRESKTTNDFLRYQWERLASKAVDFGGLLSVKYLSMPKLAARPRFRMDRSRLIPTATALHRRMSEALAAGDLAALRDICVPDLFNKLSATIRQRKPGERVSWELVKYVQPLWYPRVAAHRAFQITPEEWSQQATVAVRSTQRLARHDARTGQLIPGTERLRTQTEYVVISRKIDAKSWKPSKWRVWGSRTETTLESWAKEKEFLGRLQAMNANRVAARTSR